MGEERIRLTDEERKARRRRSVAIAIGCVLLAVIFYLVTIARMSG